MWTHVGIAGPAACRSSTSQRAAWAAFARATSWTKGLLSDEVPVFHAVDVVDQPVALVKTCWDPCVRAFHTFASQSHVLSSASCWWLS